MNTPAESSAMSTHNRRWGLIEAAAKTGDRVGLVLRLHLATEVQLDQYIAIERGDERGEFVQPGRYFGDKLSISTAFGLPIPIAKVCKHLNKMRNSVAHPRDGALDLSNEEIRNFARTVDGLKEFANSERSVGDFISPLSHITNPPADAPPGALFRDKGDALDLVLAFLAFDNQFSMYINFRSRQLAFVRAIKRTG